MTGIEKRLIAWFARWSILGLAVCVAFQSAGCAASDRPRGRDAQNGVLEDPAFTKGSELPPSPTTLLALARIYRSQQRSAEAQTLLLQIIYENPRFVPAYCELAELQLKERRLHDAEATLEKGLRISRHDPVLLNNLGICRLMKSEYAGALEAFTQAAAVAPHDPRYRANMAVVLGLLGREEEALALYEQVLPPDEVASNLLVLRNARREPGKNPG